MMINLHKIWNSCSWRNTNSKYCNEIWQLIKYSFYSWRNADVIMCQGYKLDSLNWCCQLLLYSNGKKSGSFMTNCWSFTVTVTKTCKAMAFTCLWKYTVVGLLCVWARQCTSTASLQNGCIFGSQDAWFHVPTLLSADTINIFHGSNWQHQLRLSSLYPWHIMMSALRKN